MLYLASFLVFVGCYFIALTYTSVFYHRAFAHRSLQLKPWLSWWIAHTGLWVTGLDPKPWVCMHRLHHAHSDTDLDPHTPSRVGNLGILLEQKKSYENTITRLLAGDPKYTKLVADLDFPTSALYRHGYLWLLPYFLQVAIAVCLGVFIHPLIGIAYFLGIMSHPFQGWAVNAFGHSVGPRNFATSDNSRNNQWVGLLVMGEGYQNNHHRYPTSAKFSHSRLEFDLGYVACQILELVGALSIRRNGLIKTALARG